MAIRNKQTSNTQTSKKQTFKSRVARGGLVLGLISTAMLPNWAQADTSYDRARVVDVEPIYRTVAYEVPVEQCYEQRVAVAPRRASSTGPILGAIIGGALGNAVGHSKRNKQVGTVVGAVLGGSIGADVSRRNQQQHPSGRYRTEEVCETDYQTRQQRELNGYNVSYVYAGTTYHTRMNRDPGEFIRVRVRVSPAG